MAHDDKLDVYFDALNAELEGPVLLQPEKHNTVPKKRTAFCFPVTEEGSTKCRSCGRVGEFKSCPYELIEKECTWCKGTGDWYVGRPNSEPEAGSCEICNGVGTVQDVPHTFETAELLDNCVLSNDEVELYAALWCSHRRNDTLGEFIRKVAAYTIRKAKANDES